MKMTTQEEKIFYVIILAVIHFSFVYAEGTQCGQPGRPVNGTISPSGKTYFPGEKVTYSCLEGFVLFGEEGRTCLKNGTWSGKVPLCDFNLAKGKRTLQSETLWSYTPSLAVDGNKGTCSFTPKGPEPRWWQVHLGHKFNVVAIGVTISPGSFQEFTIFVIELLSNNKALYKPCTEFKGVFQTHKGLFKCNDGLGHPGQYVYIRDDRKEQQYFGLCEVEVFAFRERIPCGDPEVPINGVVTREGEVKAVYICEIGYKLEGDSVLACSSKGDWQGHPPKCLKVQCAAPHPIENGFIEIGNPRGEYIYGTEAKYECSPGYVLKGSSKVSCGHNGNWSEEAPTCQVVTCGDPPIFENSKHTFLNGSTSQLTGIVVYTCVHGFKLHSDNDDTVTTCLDTGTWRTINVTCIPFRSTLEYIVRESEGRSLDYVIPKNRSTSDTPHLVITLAVVAGILAAGMIIFAVLLLRRRFLSSLGSLSPLVVRHYDTTNNGHLHAKPAVNVSSDTAESPPYIESLGKPSNHFHTNLLQSISHQDCRNSLNYAASAEESACAMESAYEPVPSEHSYETLRKKSRSKGFNEEDSASSHDTNYESVSSDKESVGYETVSSPKDPAYETVASTREPGYEVVNDNKDSGYEIVKEGEIISDKDPGYETVQEEVPEPGYEIVRNDSRRIHGYETLKPKLPPRDLENEIDVPDILRNLATESEPVYKLPEAKVAASGEIPAEILALYAKVDKTKKNRKPKALSAPSSPPIPANHPVLNHKHSSKDSFDIPPEIKVNSLRVSRTPASGSEEDTRSLSPPASLNSEVSSSTSSVGGSLRPLPPLPH